MKLIKEIYNTLPMSSSYDDQYCEVSVHVKYKGKVYYGEARLHPEDAGFYSPKVGRAIAMSKARIKILKDETRKAREEYKNKYCFYQEVTMTKAPAEVDPTGSFYRNVTRALTKYEKLKRAMKREEANLRNYLHGQDKAIDSVKRFRNKPIEEQTDNNN